MINLDKKNTYGSCVTLTEICLKSTIPALIVALPALGIFLGIYNGAGNLIVGTVLGFGVHFVTLASQGGSQIGL